MARRRWRLTVSSIPVGATISSGANTFTATAGNTTATITGWNLATLTVLPPLHSDTDFTLVVASTATEGANGAAATTSANLVVTVNAVADAPTLTVNAASGNEDSAIGLSIATALVDTDGSETLSLTVSSIPIGATISSGANTFTATARQHDRHDHRLEPRDADHPAAAAQRPRFHAGRRLNRDRGRRTARWRRRTRTSP